MKRRHISLQFFADGGNEAVIGAGGATPEDSATITNSDASAASADVREAGDKREEEFEKLIKGGIYEDAFKKRVQAIIDRRFKQTKHLEEERAAAQPIFKLLSETYGTDSSSYGVILEKMQNDTRLVRNVSESAVVSDDNNGQTAGKPDGGAPDKADPIDKPDGSDEADAGNRRENRKSFLDMKARELCRRWTAEGERLKSRFPSFDFKTELRNPAFTALLKSGMPVGKAYTAIHSDELIKKAVSGTARAVAEQSLKSIRAQGRRPAENGLAGGSGMISRTDVSSLTGKDIRDIIKQVEKGSRIRF